MSEGTLADRYFEFLYKKVANPGISNPRHSFQKLLRVFYSTEFTWIHPRDENRAKDVQALRMEFLEETDADTNEDPLWLDSGCDMFELCIRLSRMLAFADPEAGNEKEWFWELIKNLGLYAYNDANLTERGEEHIHTKLDAVISRRYTASGEGGLFPLDYPKPGTDQRKLELWDQLNAYLLERA